LWAKQTEHVCVFTTSLKWRRNFCIGACISNSQILFDKFYFILLFSGFITYIYIFYCNIASNNVFFFQNIWNNSFWQIFQTFIYMYIPISELKSQEYNNTDILVAVM